MKAASRCCACRVPLPAWGLVIMLLPASALLLTVLVLPALERQWRIGLYTVGVALLGCCAYAALQLLRRLRLVSFCHNDAISNQRWRNEGLALALAAFPAYIAGNVLRFAFGLPAGVAAGAGLCVGCLLAVGVTAGLGWALRNEDNQVNMERDHSTLLSIPESGAEAPLMRAFLQDSIVHSDQELWRDPDIRSSSDIR
jgi:hypothetical protein